MDGWMNGWMDGSHILIFVFAILWMVQCHMESNKLVKFLGIFSVSFIPVPSFHWVNERNWKRCKYHVHYPNVSLFVFIHLYFVKNGFFPHSVAHCWIFILIIFSDVYWNRAENGVILDCMIMLVLDITFAVQTMDSTAIIILIMFDAHIQSGKKKNCVLGAVDRLRHTPHSACHQRCIKPSERSKHHIEILTINSTN